jgi:ribosomal protein L37AE/L43A
MLAQWALDDYSGDTCPKCGRRRLGKCMNGKTRCEKCNWVVEDNAYAPVSL